MDCLKPKETGEEDGTRLRMGSLSGTGEGGYGNEELYRLTGDSKREAAAAKKQAKLALILSSILFVITIILLALVIWVAVENKDNKDEVSSLTSASGGLNKTSLASQVLLSQSASPPTGYSYISSMFRGSGYWAAQNPFPVARSDHGAVATDDKIFVMGGHNSVGGFLTSLLVYDSILNSVDSSDTAGSTLAPMPAARARFASAILGGSSGAGSNTTGVIYVIGGFSSDAQVAAGTPESCMLTYNIATNTWAKGACVQTARSDACAAAVGGKIYVAGGFGAGLAPLTSIEVYDPVKLAFSKVADLPSGRGDPACAGLGNVLYVAGGFSSSTAPTGSVDTAIAELVALDTTTGKISQKAPMLAARGDASLVVLPDSNQLQIVGGGYHTMESRISHALIALHSTEVYVPSSDMWIAKAPMGTPRYRLAAVYADQGVYAIGGQVYCTSSPKSDQCFSKAVDSVEVFYDTTHPNVFLHSATPAAKATSSSSSTGGGVLVLNQTTPVTGYSWSGSLFRGSGYWARAADLPSSLGDHLALAYGDQAFIVGGTNDTDVPNIVNTLYLYDPLLQQYTRKADMPEPRNRCAGAILGDKIYIVGGYNDISDTAPPADKMMVYDILKDTWSYSTAKLNVPRSDCCMTPVGGVLYLSGGYSTNYTAELSVLEAFDPNTNTWTQLAADMPTPRGDVICATLLGQAVFVGGYYDPTGSFAPSAFVNAVEAYNPVSGKWTAFADLPDARGDMALTAMPGGRLLVMGGETHARGDRTHVATHQVSEYVAAHDVWIEKAPMSQSRFRHAATFTEGSVLVFGGATSSLEKIDPTTGESSLVDRSLTSSESFFDTENQDVFLYLQQ